MTRDEAVNQLMKSMGSKSAEWAGSWIDSFESLGILKLDEPVNKIATIDSIIRRHAEPRVADCIMGALRNSKLIEK